MMAVLAGEIYQRRARLWPLIPMFALWANFHGGFIVGLGALRIAEWFWVFEKFYRYDRKRSRRPGGSQPLRRMRPGDSAEIRLLGWGVWTTAVPFYQDPLDKEFCLATGCR